MCVVPPMISFHFDADCKPQPSSCRHLANQAQFYEKSENYGVAISSVPDNDNSDFLVQISAPINYGWTALGTGDKMDGSLMFIVFPTSSGDGKPILALALKCN